MEQILATRLDLTQREKTAIREALDLVDGKIKVALATIGQRPKETEEELVAALKERERLHSITPQNNVEERQFMRELESLRQKKKYVQQYTVQQAALDELKTRRTVLSKELREKERAIEELSTGIKKLKLAAIVGCSTSDIVEQKFTVPESRMAQVIGKGGSNLRSVEAEFNVSIDTDRTGGGLRIMGTEKAIATAHAAVLTTVNTITEELNLREEAVVCLILDKAALSQEIQTRYNVRLDISRAKKMFKIIGLPESILAAKRDIAAIDCAREQVAIDARVLPFIVGKGGATIRALGDNHRVQIDIVREKNTIDVLGFRDDVRTVAALLRDIVDENLEVEERILVHKNIMLGCIVGTGGQIVRNLQKELNVQLKVEKEEKGATDCLVIRGNTAKVFNAKLHINGLIEEYIGNTETVHVEDEYLPIIVGKKGSRIKAIREEHPEAVIDIEDNSVQIHCKDAATRAAVRQAIEDILAANHVRVVKVTSDVIILMKGQKCADLRSVLTGGELSLGMDILAEDNTIRLRGTREKADRGAAIIEAFQIANNSEVFHVNDEDCSVLLTGGSDAPIKALETEFSVEIHVLKKDSTVRLRGPAESIRAAKEALQSLLSGDLSRGSFLLTVDPIAFSSIIGKGGATHRKMEADHNVKIDLLKSCNQIRIRGTPEEVAAAKMVIVEFLDDVRTTSKMEVPEPAAGIVAAPLNPEQLEKVVKTAASLYHVEIDNDDGLLILKGHLKFVEEAKRYLTEHIQGSAVCKLQILGYQLDEIKPHTDTKLLAIEQKHRVKIELEESPPAIAISGVTHHVDNAKIELFRFLDTMFPAEFASVAMTSDCLREVGASRTLLEITDIAGNVFLSVDRPLSCIRIRGDAAAVATAVAMIRDRLSLWQGRHAHVDIEEYMLPTIVGKNGVAIMALQKECGVSIHINRDLMRLEIQGSDQETVRSAVAKVAEIAMRLRTGFWETKLELDLVGLVIGKQGANVKKLRSETGATIDIDPRTCIIKVG
jgi:polyribonucleotide nucleotidyltransferase